MNVNSGAAGTGTNLGALVFAGSVVQAKTGSAPAGPNVYYKNFEPRIGFCLRSQLPRITRPSFSASYSVLNAPILQWQQIYGGLPAGYSNISQINNTGQRICCRVSCWITGSRDNFCSTFIRAPVGVPTIPTNAELRPFAAQRTKHQLHASRDFGKPGLRSDL